VAKIVQLNSTAVKTFELHIDKEVDNDNKLYKWYERSMGRMVHGTNSQWYEKSRHLLSALIRSPYSRLQPRDDSSSSSSKDEDEDRQAPTPTATTSGASESTMAAAASTSDDCSEVCLVAPRAGFALFYSAPKRCPESWPT